MVGNGWKEAGGPRARTRARATRLHEFTYLGGVVLLVDVRTGHTALLNRVPSRRFKTHGSAESTPYSWILTGRLHPFQYSLFRAPLPRILCILTPTGCSLCGLCSACLRRQGWFVELRPSALRDRDTDDVRDPRRRLFFVLLDDARWEWTSPQLLDDLAAFRIDWTPVTETLALRATPDWPARAPDAPWTFKEARTVLSATRGQGVSGFELCVALRRCGHPLLSDLVEWRLVRDPLTYKPDTLAQQ